MRLTTANGNVETSGLAPSTTFGIATNGKAFKVLSDTIYQDKVGSLVRETACNGIDSHTANGNIDTPLIIHLPDAFEPWYSVQDFGTGLSPDMMTQVFCIYFASTKDQSNDAIGAFGLGAKTPFAYSDKFTITSIFDGRKYVYSAFTADDGTPTLALFADEESDEATGITIEVPVEPADFRTFVNAVREQLRFFTVKPTIMNGREFEFDALPSMIYDTDRISIMDNSQGNNSGYNSRSRNDDWTRSYILQGPVGYQLDQHKIMDKMDSKNANFLRVLLNNGAWFKFQIGQIGVTASREGIEYNKQTIANFERQLNEIRTELTDWVSQQLGTATGAYEKARLVNQMAAFSSLIDSLNVDMAPAVRISGEYGFKLNTVESFYKDIEEIDYTGKKKTRKQNRVLVTVYKRNSDGTMSTSRSGGVDVNFIPGKDDEKVIMLRDTDKVPVARIRHYLDNNPNIQCVVSIASVESFDHFTDEFIEEINYALGGLNVVNRVSDLVEPPRNAGARSRSDFSRPTAYRAMRSASVLESVAGWDREYEKLDDPEFGMDDDGNELKEALYVVVERQRVISPIDHRLFHNMAKGNFIDKPIYGIRSNDIAKMEDSDITWVKLEDYMEEKRQELSADPKIKRHSIASTITTILGRRMPSMLEGNKDLDKETLLSRMMHAYNKSKQLLDASSVNSYALEIAKTDVSAHALVQYIENTSSRMMDGMPLLDYYINNGYNVPSDSDKAHIVAYVNQFALRR